MVEKDRGAASRHPRVDVSPAISDDKARFEADIPLLRRRQEQPGERLAALASIAVVVRANKDVVHRNRLAENLMHLIQGAGGLYAACNVRLVGHHNEEKASLSEAKAGIFHSRKELELLERLRCVR
jgi:hypothetical protein